MLSCVYVPPSFRGCIASSDSSAGGMVWGPYGAVDASAIMGTRQYAQRGSRAKDSYIQTYNRRNSVWYEGSSYEMPSRVRAARAFDRKNARLRGNGESLDKRPGQSLKPLDQ